MTVSTSIALLLKNGYVTPARISMPSTAAKTLLCAPESHIMYSATSPSTRKDENPRLQETFQRKEKIYAASSEPSTKAWWTYPASSDYRPKSIVASTHIVLIFLNYADGVVVNYLTANTPDSTRNAAPIM